MLKNIINIFFLGIGGIGMSALARWMKIKGFNVQGWDDQLDTTIINTLIDEDIFVYNKSIEDRFNLTYNTFKSENTILIYTPAIANSHPVFKLFQSKNIKFYKRSELLQYISLDYKVIAISGTHGKTTISIMLSHILKYSGINCNAFVGGISKNYQSNFMIGSSDIMVVEADEYDKSFLRLSPEISLVSSLDKDHCDIYETYEDMVVAYKEFIHNTKSHVIGNCNLDQEFDYTYSLKNGSDFYASDISLDENWLKFKINFPNGQSVNTAIQFSSYYNIENAIGASALAFLVGVDPISIGKSLIEFKGVERRLDYHSVSSDIIFIDDYAHHPEELKSLINNVRVLHPNKEILLIFQPHLFSRTKEFEHQFIDVLSSVDKLILLDIYPAREKAIPNINSRNLFHKINIQNKWFFNKKTDIIKLKKILLSYPTELLITAGAGDINKLIPEIKLILNSQELLPGSFKNY